MVFETFDKDVASSDSLGKTNPLSFLMLTENEELKTHNLVLLDKNEKKTGDIVVTTQFIVAPPDSDPNPEINKNCILKLTIGEATFLKDNDAIGK